MLTGLERNSDMVIGSMYAPILVHENELNWGTNMVGFDAARSYGSPSYWVVNMFGKHRQAGSRQPPDRRRRARAGGVQDHQGRPTTFYVKIVNYSNQQQSARIRFRGVSRVDEGVQTVLTGDPNARNTLANPTAIVPGAPKALSNLSLNPRFTFPGSSVTVIKLVGALGDPKRTPPTSVTPEPIDVGGRVPATLALSLGNRPAFAALDAGRDARRPRMHDRDGDVLGGRRHADGERPVDDGARPSGQRHHRAGAAAPGGQARDCRRR